MANPVTPRDAANNSEAAHLHKRPGTGTNNCTCMLQGGKSIPLLVVTRRGLSLLGRDWLGQLKLDWQKLFQVNQLKHSLQAIPDKHNAVFKNELGEAMGITAKLSYFCRARTVYHLLRNKIK